MMDVRNLTLGHQLQHFEQEGWDQQAMVQQCAQDDFERLLRGSGHRIRQLAYSDHTICYQRSETGAVKGHMQRYNDEGYPACDGG